VGSGGTIGVELSDENMEVIDFGIPILSVHTIRLAQRSMSIGSTGHSAPSTSSEVPRPARLAVGVKRK